MAGQLFVAFVGQTPCQAVLMLDQVFRSVLLIVLFRKFEFDGGLISGCS
jgi:hypothetical protein